MDVLIVDDDDFALNVLDSTLSRMGFKAVMARNGREAMDVLLSSEIRLVITDWDMPEMNGVDLCRLVRREDLSGYVYIIMLTGREGAKQRMEGLCAGADDFLNKPLDPEELLVCLKTAERILSLETRDLALFAMAKLAESRDPDAGAHIERVQSYARLIAQHLPVEIKACYGVDDEYIRLLYQTSPLHDLGKVSIPDAILLKPGKLTTDEFDVMKTHTLVGAETLGAALHRFPNAKFLQMARDIAASHHEKFDGSGYPQGLSGDQIPLCGRIVAVADVYDALTSRRVYKTAMAHEMAKKIIIKDRGSHFDPEVVDAFLLAEKQVTAVKLRLQDDVEPPAPAEQPIPVPEAGQAGANPSKILIAEDDPVLLAKLTELLAATGEPIFTATNGAEAMKLITERGPRVVVSDWVMPEMDGLQLCKAIRGRSDDISPIHFIMLTANTQKSQLLDAYESGIDDFVSKPFDAEELLARVRAGLRATKLHDELMRKNAGSIARSAQLATMNSRLERLSITDELTGLFNRRHAMFRLNEQWAMAERYSRPVSVAMLDIDHFKQINDTYGHDAGDTILRKMGTILREATRATDAVCRVGGEEFLIIFPSQTVQEVQVCAERCRRTTQMQPFEIDGKQITVTISIGLASRSTEMQQFPDLLKAADQALYAAKHGGRNRVCIADQTQEQPQVSNPTSSPAPSSAAASGPAASSAAVPVASAAPIDLSAVLKRCGGDPKFANAVTERFRSQAGNEVTRIEQALNAGDAALLTRAAHSLKSMTAYMGADQTSALARQIEELGRENQLAKASPLLDSLRKQIDEAVGWIAANSPTLLKCA
jgi:putative two-component system response regulator